jgi:hypothetical protein
VTARFEFQPRWKEELVCRCREGAFVLELPMGVLSAYLPTEAEWQRRAPLWARTMWPVLHAELADWCRRYDAKLYIEATATIEEL